LHAYVELASAKPVPPKRFKPDAVVEQEQKKPADPPK